MTRPVWRIPGMPALLTMALLGFAGYAALLPVAPLWVVHGGAGTAGAGLVNGVLLLFTVLAQPLVPGALRRFGWAPVLVAGMLLMLLPGAPWLAEHLGFWLVFAISAVSLLGVGAALALARAVDHAQKRHPHPREPVDTKASGSTLTRLLRPTLLLLGVTLAGGAVLSFLPQMSPSASLTSAGLFLLTLATALSRWRAGSLSDRHGAQPFLWPLVLLTVVSLSAVAWSVRDLRPTQAVVLLAGMTLLGVCYGGLQNLTLVVSFNSVARAHYGRASAVWNVGFDLGTGLGSVLVGVVAAGTSFTVALLSAAVISLATLPLALYRPRGTISFDETPSAGGH